MRFIAYLCMALAAGCAHDRKDDPVPVDPPPTAAREEPAALAEPLPTVAPKREEASLPRLPPASKPSTPSVKVPAKVASPAPQVLEPRRSEAPPAIASKPAPPLDVAALKARLKDTHGIGVLAKLALKNQMDDLLKQLRASHAGRASVAPLRARYDTLIAKAVSVLHDGDPGLAGTIAQSREAIWDLLADPVKFHEAS
jgi:hypothetical protein